MSKSIRLILALLVMPALAFCAASESLSTILADSLPDRALKLPLVDANAYTNEGLQHLSGVEASGGKSLQDLALNSGRRTFDAEPTNSAAISLLAFGHQLRGDTAIARTLYEDALRLSQRDRLANLWLIEDASQRGQIGYILDRYDVLLRTGGAASDVLFDVLGTALREDAVVPYLEERLARRPPWSEEFWLKVAPNAAAIANVGRLRLRLLERGVPNPAGNDADILHRLIANGQFDTAFGLFNKLTAAQPRPPGPIQNEDFANPARFAPLDWETFSASGYGAEVDPAASALVLHVEDNLEALVARQLIEAAPGSYVIRYRSGNTSPSSPIRTSLHMRCAEAEKPELLSIPMNSASGAATVSLPDTGCHYFWLEIRARREASGSPADDDALIDSIAMRAVH